MEAVEENSSFLGNAERVFHYFPTPPCPVLWLPSVFIRYLLSAWDTVPSSWLPARIWKTTRQCITCLLLCENGSLNLPWEPVHLASRPNIHPVCIWSWEPGLWPSRKLGQCYLYVANFVSAENRQLFQVYPSIRHIQRPGNRGDEALLCLLSVWQLGYAGSGPPVFFGG